MISKLKKLSFNQIFILLIGTIFLIINICLAYKVFYRLSYELQNPMTFDAVMYWVVGKGFSSGNALYAGYYENKPPMIFFLMSLSYSLFGNYHLSNILCFLCLLVIGFAPVIYIIIKAFKTPSKSIVGTIVSLLFAYPIGVLLMLYTQIRSGEAQVENYGAAFIIIYLLIIILSNSDKKKWYSISIFVASFMLMVGVMFKEPFALVALFSSLMICRSKKDLIYKIILPFTYGGLMGLLLLICTNSLNPYFSIYISNMFQNHINIYGSPFERGKNFQRLFDDMGKFSLALPALIGLFSVTTLVINILHAANKHKKNIFKLLFMGIAILIFLLGFYCTSFAVGLGGQYYNHHYVFAIPMYMIFILINCEFMFHIRFENNEKVQNVFSYQYSILAFVFALIGSSFATYGISNLPKYSYNQHVLSREKVMIENAFYVDTVLDIYEKETYQYLGFNGFLYLGHTKHMPKGPIFVQDPHNFKDENSFFVTSLKTQITEVDVIIYNRINVGVLNEWVTQYLKDNFEVFKYSSYNLTLPKEFKDTIYIRKDIL